MPPPIPVVLVPYDPSWPRLAAAFGEELQVLGPVLVAVHHIGSTSVPGLAAKPIIDLMPLVTSLTDLERHRARVEALGYGWYGELGIPERRYCARSDAAGNCIAQLHFFAADSPQVARHLAFRDYLRAHSAAARSYEEEKRRARDLHPNDSHAYTDAKADWIRRIEATALAWAADSGVSTLPSQPYRLPILKTERLLLREITESDAPAYERNFVDYEVISQLSATVPWPYPEGGVLDWIRTQIIPMQGQGKWVWGIFLKEQPDEVIGVVDLWRKPSPENRGFWLGRKYWGTGIMTEAVVPVMNHAFDHLAFETLVFANAVGNKRSHRIKEKTGARLLRTEPAKFVNPLYTEREIWEITKDEWNAFRERFSHR
jgi:[ribosomal protein S5]-alanine N-acetyltransferase